MNNSNKKKIFLLIICTFFSIFLLYLIMSINNSKDLNEKFIQIMHMPASSVQGTLSALNMFICIIMVFIHYDYGKKIGICCIGFSILSSTLFMIRSHNFAPIPGIAASFISLITIEVFARYYKKITISSLTDYLTGLKNRRAFVNDLEDNIDSHTPFYLAYFDMKNFQSLNASYGVEAGNVIVKTIAGRLAGRIEKDDLLYRMESTTSFALIFRPNKNADKKVKELLYGLKKPIHFEQNGNDHEYSIDMVAAIIKYPEDGESFLELTKCVDVALTYAKNNHQDFTSYSNKDIQQEQKKHIETENLINEALMNKYFFMVYQPQFDIKTKKLRGFESLIRCKKPDGTIISPGVFIPVAEQSDLILKIDEYVLQRAMTEFKQVIDEYKIPLIISINVSAKNISNPNFAPNIEYLLEKTGFPPNCLEIEITEYTLTRSIEIAYSNIHSLRNKGVMFALDDFGTGYTSISQLLRLPVNLLKIDKSLVDNIETDILNQELVDSVIYMGHTMKCEVISEGVENERQLEILKSHGCDFVQGYVFGKPMSYNDAIELYKKESNII